MKKLTLISAILIASYSFTSAQIFGFKTADYTSHIDSFTAEKVVKDVTFTCGGDLILTKDSTPSESISVRHKLKIVDIRVKIPSGTEGRVINITYVTKDTTFLDPKAPAGSGKTITITKSRKKVYWVSFDTEKGVAVVPFTTGAYPGSNTPFNPDLSVGPNGAATAFVLDNHLYQVEGSATLQLPQKLIDELRKASGNGF